MSGKCKESVCYDGWHHSGCSRNAILDGYCKQHHPKTVQAKRDAQDAKYEADRAKRKLADDIAAAASAIVDAADKVRDNRLSNAAFDALAIAVDAWRKLKGM